MDRLLESKIVFIIKKIIYKFSKTVASNDQIKMHLKARSFSFCNIIFVLVYVFVFVLAHISVWVLTGTERQCLTNLLELKT